MIEKFRQRERSKGVLNAILHLRNSAFFPKKHRGAVAYGRMAGSYLHKVVVKSLRLPFLCDVEIERFLDWCEDRTLKVSPFGFKERELRNPVEATLPIYIGETASYIRYFVQRACSATSEERALQFAEMAVFLGLCCAAARGRSGYFDIVDILKVEANAISLVSVKEKLAYQYRMENVIEKPKKSLKGGHNVLLMKLSEGFLDDESLWSLTSGKGQPSQDLGEECSYENISIGERLIVISHALASAIRMIGSFSISRREAENLLQEAYEAVGLSQSSGRISPSCFLKQPHYWEKVDTRKSYKTQMKQSKARKIRKI
ncbi:MAG: hypothetical protein JSS09_00495 [Verrucomicrobia bacterium]|nr:hypothetical protein [Verrucomicrobiota bacterium]